MDVGNVMEVSKRMQDVLVREGCVYIKWRARKVKDFMNVLRYHKVFCLQALDERVQCG